VEATVATTEEAVIAEAMTEEVVTAVVMAAAVVAVVAAPSFTSEASALTPAKKPWSRSSPSEPCLHSLGPQHQTSAFISLPSTPHSFHSPPSIFYSSLSAGTGEYPMPLFHQTGRTPAGTAASAL
jgi:hypothetical protein